MRKYLYLLLLLTLLLPGQALAAKYITAVYGDPADDAVRIIAQDAKTYRMDFLRNGAFTGEYFLMNKNGRWFVDVSDPQKPEALDMAEVYKLAEITPEDFEDKNAEFTKTDRKATFAGIEGLVWEVKDTFFGGTDELVLTTNKDLVLLTKGFVQFLNDFAILTMFGGNGPASLITGINAAEKKEYGFLKYKGDELTSLEKEDYPKDYFTLPKNVKMAELK